MLSNLLSLYKYRYLRSLVYMLQASEYDVREYLHWYNRTKNFSNVEERKTLVLTKKSLLLLCVLILFVGLIGVNIFLLIESKEYIPAAVLFIGAPYMVAYSLALFTFLIKLFIQKPIEFFILRQARKTLASHKGFKIAIAGSYGKTSMREILKTVLSEGKVVAAPSHSHNTPLGIAAFVKTLTGSEEVLIFELGEYYPGDVYKLCKLVRPDLGVITGINEAHLQKFKTLESTADTIFELADFLDGKTVYVNKDNEMAKGYAEETHILYGKDGVGEWKVGDTHTDLSGTSFTLTSNTSQLTAHSKLLGLHQVGPLCAAVHIARSLGLKDADIISGIAKTAPFEHRLEPKTDGSGVTTLDDSYNGNPDGVKAVIDFLFALKGRRRFYVTPGLVEMGPRAEAVHVAIGQALTAASIEKVILIRNSVTSFIEKGLKESGYKGDIIWFDTALEAFAAIPNLTVSGDIVLLQNDWPDQYK